MRTIDLMGDYRDVLFYLFIVGVIYWLWNIHNLIDKRK